MSDSLPADLHPQEHDDLEEGVPSIHEAAEYVDNVLPPKPKHKGRKAFVWLVVLLVIVALAAGAYLLHKSQTDKGTKQPATSQSAVAQPKAQATNLAATPYTSDNYNLSFSYPAGWTVSDPAGGKLTVISPAVSLVAATGQQANAKVLLTIQNQQTTLPDFKSGNATAVLDSQRVAYTKPTSTQRANTYLSYIQYAATTTNGALDAIYVTGDFGYQKGQDVPMTDIAKVNPLISVTFLKCGDQQCSTTSALSLEASSWAKSSVAAGVQSTLESLAIN